MKFPITIVVFLFFNSLAMGHSNRIYEQISAGFGIPRGLLLTMCERESGAREDKMQVLRPKITHDGGAGAGACGMKIATATRVLGRPVTRQELQEIPFSAVLSARYLTDERWCGRWARWEVRVLCYRVGPNHRVLPRMQGVSWERMPKWWGTHKIFKRWSALHGSS